MIPYRQEYGGCRSWINLAEPISIEGIVPVLNDAEYTEQASQICEIINKSGVSYLDSAKSHT
jgi:hypothetical protein